MNSHINICQDAVFKAIFTKSREALRSLLSAFLEQDLSVITVITNEPPIAGLRDRQIRFDITVKFDGGRLADVEMTLSPRRTEAFRFEYHLSRLFLNQDIRGAGRSFRDLKPAYLLSFLDGSIYNDGEWLHRFIFYDPERKISMGGQTAIITVELKKLKEVADKAVREMDRREEWAVFLKYRRETAKQGVIKEILKAERGIAMAEQVIEGFTETELEGFRAMWRDMAELDRREHIYWLKEDARAEGLAEGLAEGRTEGLAEGSRQKQLEIAREMKAGGVPPDQIARFTGLSLEEITG